MRVGTGVVAVMLSALSSAAGAQQLGEVARAVLEDGQPRTVQITDGFAEYVRQVTASSGPVYGDVSVVRTYAQPGCRRMRVVVRAPEAVVVDAASGERRSFAFTYEIDLCADGSPPLKR